MYAHADTHTKSVGRQWRFVVARRAEASILHLSGLVIFLAGTFEIVQQNLDMQPVSCTSFGHSPDKVQLGMALALGCGFS